MAQSSSSNDGCFGAGGVGGVVVVIVVFMIMDLPSQIWIVLAVLVGLGIAAWIGVQIHRASEERKAEQAAAAKRAQERAREEKREQERQREQERKRAEKLRRALEQKQERERKRALEQQRYQERRERATRLGKSNVKRVDAALDAVERIAGSEAAREGWLGEVDFGSDIQDISGRFEQATRLRETADQLRKLSARTAEDNRVLGEAQDAIGELESSANRLVKLIKKCADEVGRIDVSIRKEREDAQTAEQRIELHGRLSAMLYGAETVSGDPEAESAASRILSRVEGYREIKQELADARVN